MKPWSFLGLLVLSVVFSTAHATETIAEQIESSSKEIKREAKKTVNRAEEALCTESEAECMKKKLKNRTEETFEALKDKATDLKNKLD